MVGTSCHVGGGTGERAVMVIFGEGGVGEAAVVRAGLGGFVEGVEVVEPFVVGFEAFFGQVRVAGQHGQASQEFRQLRRP